MTKRIDIEDFDNNLVDSFEFSKHSIIFNNMGIDSVRLVVRYESILKIADKLDLIAVHSWENTPANKVIKDIEKKAIHDSKQSKNGKYVPLVKVFRLRKGGKNLSDYMIVLLNVDETLKEAKRHKKAKNYFCLMTFAGLHQPTKDIRIESMRTIKRIMKRKAMKLNSVDVAVDTLDDKKVNSKTKEDFKNRMGEVAKNGVISYQGTHYVNEPHDKGNVSKIAYYDKAQKQEVHHNQKLNKNLKKWKRIEITISPKKRMCFADYVKSEEFLEDMANVKEVVQDTNVGEYRDDYINYQINNFVDGRTMNTKEGKKKYNSKKALKSFSDSDNIKHLAIL